MGAERRPASRRAAQSGRDAPRFAEAVYRLVKGIPAGRVATYGQLAAMLDRPRAARAVGTAMRNCPAGIPWHRVVNAQGAVSRRGRVASMLTQKIRLEQEGVTLRRGRVSLRRHRWDPRSERCARPRRIAIDEWRDGAPGLASSALARWRWEDDDS